jgi:hypothetical protein
MHGYVYEQCPGSLDISVILIFDVTL